MKKFWITQFFEPPLKFRMRWSTVLPAILALVTLFFVFWQPIQPEKMFHALPYSAAAVSAHRQFGSRYMALATNGIVRGFLQSAGMEDVAALQRWQPYAKCLADKLVLFGWLPRRMPDEQPALAVISWTGNAGLFTRLMLQLFCPRDFILLPPMADHAVWTTAKPVAPGGWRFTFTFHDGMLLGVLAPRPTAILSVIRAADGAMPPAPILADRNFQALSETALDRFWLNRPYNFAAQVNLSKAALSAEIYAHDLLPTNGQSLSTAQLPFPAALIGNAPEIVAWLQMDAAAALMARCDAPFAAIGGVLTGYASAEPRRDCLGFAVFTGADGGALGAFPWRVNVPAAVLCLRIGGEADAHAIVKKLLDRLNAVFRLGLVPAGCIATVGAARLFSIETTVDNFLARLPPEDRPAYALTDEWLLLASHAGALKRRLEAAANNHPAGQAPAWLSALEETPSAGYFQFDTESGSHVLQLALTALTVQTYGHYGRQLPFWLKTLRRWTDTARRPGEIRVRIDAARPMLAIDFLQFQ